jgi:hypothetical protein
MFDLAIDSKPRGCAVVKVKIGGMVSGGRIRSRAVVVQQKTGKPVRFELLEAARGSMRHGLNAEVARSMSWFSRAVLMAQPTSALDGMPGSSMNG